MSPQSDRAVRGLTEDGGFRVITARTTDLVRDAARVHGCEGQTIRVFGELLTGAALVRETMSPAHRVQMILGQNDGSAMVADASPQGGLTRGLVRLKSGAVVESLMTEESLLKVIRTLPRGKLHQSVVSAGDGGSISETLMQYLTNSAQVMVTMVATTVLNGDHVVASGGYVVQLLPELQKGPLAVMTERLRVDFAHLDERLIKTDADPDDLLREILYGMPYAELASSPLSYGCEHGQDRAILALMSMGREELAAIAARNEVVDMTCDYCGTRFEVPPEQVRNMLASN